VMRDEDADGGATAAHGQILMQAAWDGQLQMGPRQPSPRVDTPDPSSPPAARPQAGQGPG
jgi:hypothetical protein